MVLDQFCILFDDDNPEGIFSAGQTVTGRLHLSVSDKPETLKGITLHCKGFCRVHFSRQTKIFETKEDYFSIKIPILTASVNDVDGEMSLATGQHNYPFSFVLPNTIPCSFEGKYGHIRYRIRGAIKRRYLMVDEECSKDFKVNICVDLNQNPSAKMPGSATDSKTICCCCCSSGPISARCWMTQSGYIPGQTIYFNGEVENRSGKMMQSSIVRLIEVTAFYAQGRKESNERIVGEIKHGPFGPSDLWTDEPILIPSDLAPSNLPYCNIIKLSYRIEYEIDPGLNSINLNLSMEVIIGTIPATL